MAWRELASIIASVLAFLFVLGAFAPFAEELGLIPKDFPLVSFSRPKLKFEQKAPCMTHELGDRSKCDKEGRKVIGDGTASSRDSIIGIAVNCATEGYSPIGSCRIAGREYPQIWRFYVYSFLWLCSLAVSLWGIRLFWRNRTAYVKALRRLLKQLLRRKHDASPFPTTPPRFRHAHTMVDVLFVSFATWIYYNFADYLMRVDNPSPPSNITYSVVNLEAIILVAVGVVSLKCFLWWYWFRRRAPLNSPSTRAGGFSAA
jgi:hypothetical protein